MRHKDVDWDVGPNISSAEGMMIPLLMDIRDELKSMNKRSIAMALTPHDHEHAKSGYPPHPKHNNDGTVTWPLENAEVKRSVNPHQKFYWVVNALMGLSLFLCLALLYLLMRHK